MMKPYLYTCYRQLGATLGLSEASHMDGELVMEELAVHGKYTSGWYGSHGVGQPVSFQESH